MDRGLVPGHAWRPHHRAEHRTAPVVQQPYLYDVLGEHVQAGRLEVLGVARPCGYPSQTFFRAPIPPPPRILHPSPNQPGGAKVQVEDFQFARDGRRPCVEQLRVEEAVAPTTPERLGGQLAAIRHELAVDCDGAALVVFGYTMALPRRAREWRTAPRAHGRVGLELKAES